MKASKKPTEMAGTIGQVSKTTGCKIETIRYYERIGLLPEPPRSAGGFRLYQKQHIKRVSFIRRARRLGFSLDEIGGLLGLVDEKSYTCAEVKQITEGHLHAVEQRIADLRRLRKVLAEMSAQCEGGLVPDCPVIDALFK